MKKILLTVSLCVMGTFLFSQNMLERIYDYDAAGNRICRRLVTVPAPGDGGGAKPATVESTNDVTDNTYYTETIGNIRVHVFPNPVQEKLSVQITNYGDFQSGELFLYTLDGKYLHKIVVNSPTIEINLSEYSSGTYLLKLKINDFGQEWKIIKQ